MYTTYLTWHECDLDHSLSLRTNDPLIRLYDIITGRCSLDLIDNVSRLGGVSDLEV